MENFGLSFAEDQTENTPGAILGEYRLKETFVPSVRRDSLLTSDYPVLERVADLNLLTLTAESGLLEALEAKGLTLSTLEKLLPVAEDLGVLSLIQNPIVVNLIAPLLIEPAPFLLPGLVSLINLPSQFYTLIAVALLAIDANGFIADEEISIPLLVGATLFAGLGVLSSGGVSVPSSSGGGSRASSPSSASSPQPSISSDGATRRKGIRI